LRSWRPLRFRSLPLPLFVPLPLPFIPHFAFRIPHFPFVSVPAKMRLTCTARTAETGTADQGAGRKLPKRQGSGNRKVTDNAEQHLAAQLAGRVLSLGTARNNNGGNRQPATGNRGGIRTTSIEA
jgi:hypothetical protein